MLSILLSFSLAANFLDLTVGYLFSLATYVVWKMVMLWRSYASSDDRTVEDHARSLNRHLELLRVLENAGAGPLDVLGTYGVVSYYYAPFLDTEDVRLWAEFVRECSWDVRQALLRCAQQRLHEESLLIYEPRSYSHRLLRFLIASGLEISALPEGRCSLIAALSVLNACKLLGNLDSVCDPRKTSETLSYLIDAGADIYSIGQVSDVYLIVPVPGVQIAASLAIRLGVREEWYEALRECGYDPEEVDKESARRLKEYSRLHNAERSGVDVEGIIPSVEGLSRRSGRVFEDP